MTPRAFSLFSSVRAPNIEFQWCYQLILTLLNLYPFSTFVLTLIGVSISSRKVRGGIGLPLGIGIFLCFTYIVVDRFALVFAVKGSMPPLLATCLPNGIFGLIGLYLLRKAPK